MELVGKAEILAVGAGIVGLLIVAGILTYEVKTSKVAKGVVESALGLPLIEEIKEHKEIAIGAGESALGIPLLKEVGESVIEPFIIFGDYIKGGQRYATERYANFESGSPFASQWVQIFGSDLYNDGFASVRFRSLEENAEHLAKKYKTDPADYFSKQSTAMRSIFVRKEKVDGKDAEIISPFLIRQHLESTPFSKDLRGVFGSDVNSLKTFIWTEYDELPNKISNWSSQTDSEKAHIYRLIIDDRRLLESYMMNNTYGTWIVADRVINIDQIMKKNKIII